MRSVLARALASWLISTVSVFCAAAVLTFHDCDVRLDPSASDPWLVLSTFGVMIAATIGTILFVALLLVAFVVTGLLRRTSSRFLNIVLGAPIVICAIYTVLALHQPGPHTCRL